MFKRHRYPKTIILQAVYFKLRFTLSYRDVEEILWIRGVKVDHSTIQRWVFKFSRLISIEIVLKRYLYRYLYNKKGPQIIIYQLVKDL